MAKKLYYVELEYRAYVMAESEHDAIYEAKDGLKDDYADPDFESAADVRESQKKRGSHFYVDPAWKNAIPYGSDDDKTVEQVLAEKGG